MRCFCGHLHGNLIPLAPKTRYPEAHGDCITFTRGFTRAPASHPEAAGGVARGVRQRPQDRPMAGDRLCRRPCGALDPDPGQSQGGAGRPYGCRGSLRLGAEIPARIRQAPAARRLGRGRLVPGLSGRRLGHLCAGDGGDRHRSGDLLADRIARGRSPPRVFRRGDAGALSDLQFQGLQIQSGSAAAGDAAAGRAGVSACVREANCARRRLARACRSTSADDEILGADHDRRDRIGGAAASRPAQIPALAGAVGRAGHRGGRHAPPSVVAEGSALRAADLCRRRLRTVRSRPENSSRARLHRPQSCIAGAAGRAGGTGAGLCPPLVEIGAAAVGIVYALLVARPKSGCQRLAGAF